MNTFLAHQFLGATSRQLETETFKVSVVDYTHRVSEEWHWHERVHISSILRGGNLESRKREDIQVAPGKVMVYDQGEVHRNRFTAHPSRNLNIELGEDFFGPDIEFAHLRLDESTQLEFHRIYFELALNDTQAAESICRQLQALFWKDPYRRGGEWVARLETLLQDRWDEFPSLEELSRELGVHPITISKYFAKHKGMTLSEYLRKLKVKRALQALLNTTESAAEIAFGCGFSDQSHMTRLVKAYTGYTPGAIRSLV
ncbi:MAG TPA: hypothetical protein DCR93_03330 [Cytophagales bacterium]|nr:hypothetical protein [Cytophagales bacterium]